MSPGRSWDTKGGCWLGGSGVRALQNPDRSTARVRIVTPRARTVTCPSTHPVRKLPNERNDMNSLNDSGVVAGPASGQRGHTQRLGGLAGTGVVAALASTSRSPMVAQPSRWPGSPW